MDIMGGGISVGCNSVRELAPSNGSGCTTCFYLAALPLGGMVAAALDWLG